MDKETLRKQILAERGRFSKKYLNEKSETITSTVLGSDFFIQAKSVFCYISVEGEPDTSGLILNSFSSGRKVFVPRTGENRNMETVNISESDFSAAYTDWPVVYGIPVPPFSLESSFPAGLDLVLVPSLALDKNGYRLGHGAGYYDAFIERYMSSENRPLFAAIQFSDFLRDEPVPRESFDQKVDLIITEEGVFNPYSA